MTAKMNESECYSLSADREKGQGVRDSLDRVETLSYSGTHILKSIGFKPNVFLFILNSAVRRGGSTLR